MYSATLSPAYGRDYKSKGEAMRDLAAGKDFVMHGIERVTVVNLEGLQEAGIVQVAIRYSGLRRVAVVTIPTPGSTTEVGEAR